MRLEVEVKFAKPKKGFEQNINEEESDEDKAYRNAQRIISGDLPEEREGKNILDLFSDKNFDFYYKPYIFKTEEVKDFYPYDEEHVLVVTEFGGSVAVKMDWKVWKATWEHYTGEAIQSAKPVSLKKEKNNQI